MTEVLKFPLERVTRTGNLKNTNHQAKILLFEGVRYDGDEKRAYPLKKKLDKA